MPTKYLRQDFFMAQFISWRVIKRKQMSDVIAVNYTFALIYVLKILQYKVSSNQELVLIHDNVVRFACMKL